MVIKRLSDYSSANGINLPLYHRVYSRGPQRPAICAVDPDTTRHFLFWTRVAAPLIASGRLAWWKSLIDAEEDRAFLWTSPRDPS
jgi:hypothetical protein